MRQPAVKDSISLSAEKRGEKSNISLHSRATAQAGYATEHTTAPRRTGRRGAGGGASPLQKKPPRANTQAEKIPTSERKSLESFQCRRSSVALKPRPVAEFFVFFSVFMPPDLPQKRNSVLLYHLICAAPVAFSLFYDILYFRFQ